MKRFLKIVRIFKVPIFTLATILISLIFSQILKNNLSSNIILSIGIFVGSFKLIRETYNSVKEGNFALDYIAILAISVSLISGQFLVASVIVLMLSGGNTLEDYGMEIATNALTSLKSRIPDEVFLFEKGVQSSRIKISDVKVNQEICIRKGEVIPLDGVLMSNSGFIDQSSLTGEPYEIQVYKGDIIRSGTLNVGDLIVIRVTREESGSTYRKIVNLVNEAHSAKSPFIRLADQYNTVFTIITLFLAGITYLLTLDLNRVLAVLVIATPCPLILATPIALMGGVSAAAKRRIIIKRLAGLELLAKTNYFILDKTGTITLGRPEVCSVDILDKNYSEEKIYSIALAIERSSLHPLAKSIVRAANDKNVQRLDVDNIREIVGDGIYGKVNEKTYRLHKMPNQQGMAVAIDEGSKTIAVFHFEDQIKNDVDEVISKIKSFGIVIEIFTGDKKNAVEELLAKLKNKLSYKSDCLPEDKLEGIKSLQQNGNIVCMVGDGLNDAPALAKADIGLVFSQDDQTAATEVADIVFLGGEFASVSEALAISKNTVKIAKQSILVGIGLSLLGMIFASFGFILPIFGALIQEIIDISVIINALRTTRFKADIKS